MLRSIWTSALNSNKAYFSPSWPALSDDRPLHFWWQKLKMKKKKNRSDRTLAHHRNFLDRDKFGHVKVDRIFRTLFSFHQTKNKITEKNSEIRTIFSDWSIFNLNQAQKVDFPINFLMTDLIDYWKSPLKTKLYEFQVNQLTIRPMLNCICKLWLLTDCSTLNTFSHFCK